ncbi:unnamed protein product [Brassica napus]|uniref:(rape) hypothetical protein n=1 Tax=Brassica napus TaxID=3708 RepID=A0A817ARA1_BRANA|nr:unnamed protein product [Brassica napus]
MSIGDAIQNHSETAPLLPESGRDGEIGHDEFNGASFTGAVFNLATTIIGAGIMALPATMKILGLVPGIAMIVLMAILTDSTIEFLLRFSRIGKTRSYGSLMEDSFGITGKIVLQASVLVSNIGVLIVYMIIIGDVLAGKDEFGIHHAGILEGWFGEYWWNTRTFVLLISTLLVFAPLTSFKRIVHNIHNELEDPTQIKPVVRSALTVCSSVYVMTSLFGYLLFGESTLDDVLANFDTDLNIPFGSVLNDAVRFSYAAHLMLVFPIVFYPLRVNIDGLLFPKAPSLATSNLRFGSITAGLIAVIFVGANFIPSIWDAFQFTGATASVCIGFIFPAAVILKDRHNQATKRDKSLAIFVIVLAVFSNAIAIYSDAYALFEKNNSTLAI